MRKILISLLLAVVVALAAVAQSDAPTWSNFLPDGRSQTVYTIYQEPSGAVWLGSSGLYSFDGFRAHPAGMFGETHFTAQIYSILPKAGDRGFWLGTSNGLYVYDRASDAAVEVCGRVPEIRDMLISDGLIYIGSLGGLYIYDVSSGKISEAPVPLPHKAVYALTAYGPDIYIGTYDGLCRFTPRNGTSEIMRPSEGLPEGKNFFVNAVVEEPSRSSLVLGIEGSLMRFSPRTGTFSEIAGFGGHSVKDIAFTHSGDMVVATDDGLFIEPAPGSGAAVVVCRHDSRVRHSIADNIVWSLLVERGGTILAGTAMGLSVGEVDSPVRLVPLSDITGRGDGQQVFSMLRDAGGDLWIGGSNGLIRTRGGGAYEWFTSSDTDLHLSHNRVRDIAQSSDGRLWVATDGSLNLYNQATGRFGTVRLAERGGRHNANWAYGVVEDTASHRLWTGAYLGGVLVADIGRLAACAGKGVCVADTVFSSSNGMTNDLVSRIVQDSGHNKWVLLFRDSCIMRIDGATGALSRVNVSRAVGGAYPSILMANPAGGVWVAFEGGLLPVGADGAPGEPIRFVAARPDDYPAAMAQVGQNVWVAGSAGDVWEVDPVARVARILPVPARPYSAIYSDPVTGRVLLGAIDEIVAVDPLRLDIRDADLHILRVSDGQSFIDPAAGEVRLPFGNNSLHIWLATYDYVPHASRHFAWRLADLDTAWTALPDGSNEIDLKNLPEGRHRLEIKLLDAADALRSIDVRVSPPWYRSWWAYVMYAVGMSLAVLALAVASHRRHFRHIEHIERSNAIQNVDDRLDFLANMAHDLKTPLSMIIGPLSRLRDTASPSDDDTRRSVETAYQNALKLNNLVHSTVEYNRAETQADALMIYSQVDAAGFCANIVDRFREAYPDRRFEFSASPGSIPASLDAIKFESIITNLLSNAVKYAGSGATISCSVTSVGSDLSLVVADNGPGIPEQDRRLVFQRLFRSSATASASEGTGIGLYLVRQYAVMHHGTVTLDEATGGGARFTVTLPRLENVPEGGQRQEKLPVAADSRPRILVVDDNAAIAEFLTDLLGDDYACAVAHDGKSALDLIPAFRPDLIITDEMMPVMTGLELCRRLRASDTPGASTPVVVLTAKTDPDLERESVRAGADMLIAKPFDAPLLRERVAGIIEVRDRRRRAARVEAITSPVPPADSPETDYERQLAAVTGFIESNMADPQLSVNLVCERLGLQSKQLYRLVKKYVGLTPVDYIRQTRLRRAALLLEQKRFTVSEVMYMVGFSSPSYFSKCFSAMYGCRPSQYKGSDPGPVEK